MGGSSDRRVIGNICIGVSIPLLIVASALYWNESSKWGASVPQTRSFNTCVFAFPLILVCGFLASYCRSLCMNGMAYIFLLVMAGITSHITVTSDYLGPSLPNYARLLLQENLGSDTETLKMTLAAYIIGQSGTWLALIGAVMATCPMQEHHRRTNTMWILAVVAVIFALTGCTVLFTSDGVAFKIINPTQPHSGLYGGIMDVCFTTIVLAALMTISMCFDVLEMFAAVVIGGTSGGIWLLGNVVALQDQRIMIAETPLGGVDFEARLWAGGVICWISCILSLTTASMYLVA